MPAIQAAPQKRTDRADRIFRRTAKPTLEDEHCIAPTVLARPTQAIFQHLSCG
jgi:hypothetical protein